MVIFADGLESNDFSQWTGTTVSAGCSAAVQAGTVHCGGFAAEFYIDGNGGYDKAAAYKDIVAATTLYTRHYFSLDTLPADTKRATLIVHRNKANGAILQAGIYNDGGTYKVFLSYYRAFSRHLYSGAIAIAINTWYHFEAYSLIHAAAGAHTIYFKNVAEITTGAVDTDDHGSIDQLHAGSYTDIAGGNDWEHTMYVDCVVGDTSYVGLEAVVSQRLLLGVGL